MFNGIMNTRKRKQPVLEKTHASTLQELCDKENQELKIAHFTCDVNTQLFYCTVDALEVSAIGSGRTKKEAKQNACEQVICE